MKKKEVINKENLELINTEVNTLDKNRIPSTSKIRKPTYNYKNKFKKYNPKDEYNKWTPNK